MKTLWNKGASLDEVIADFTVGDDREIDRHIARHDILGSLAHVDVLTDARILSQAEAAALKSELRLLYKRALTEPEFGPGAQDEDIHSALERYLTERLGDAGRRVHTARSRNDQVATALALWMREQALEAHGELLEAVRAIQRWATDHADDTLPGTTHLQPAMPTTFGFWAAGYASLLLDDAALLRAAFDASDACPLGSAAGYGVPPELAPIDRAVSAERLGFSRVAHPVTAVQGGRGKPEATLLFAATQIGTTCARLARDVVLFVHPAFGFLRLPARFTTGSSIMPQKKNPDVFELIRGKHATISAALHEVLALAASVGSGYHRDFQLLKGPTIRGVSAARAVIQMVGHVFSELLADVERAEASCPPELYATHRALDLVAQGVPFRDAYRQVAEEVEAGTLPTPSTDAVPPLEPALDQIEARRADAASWHDTQRAHVDHVVERLVR